MGGNRWMYVKGGKRAKERRGELVVFDIMGVFR